MLWFPLFIPESLADTCAVYENPERLVVTAPVAESSGLAASRSRPGVLFTHGDSGGSALLYAVTLDGRYLGSHFTRGAPMFDWEDLAPGPCPKDGEPCLYIGDIGDNDLVRPSISVHVVREPEEGKDARLLETWQAVYPDGPRDAETLLVHPCTGDIYLVTKEEEATGSVYRFPRERSGTVTLEKVAELVLDGKRPFTGGQWDPEGERLVLRSRDRIWQWQTDPADPDAHWDSPPSAIAEMDEEQGEAVAFTLDGGLVTSSEGAPLIMHLLPCQELGPSADECAFVAEEGCGCRSVRPGVEALPLLLTAAALQRRKRRTVSQEE